MVLTFDTETKEWSAYSCVPKHIRKLVEIVREENVTVIESDNECKALAVKCTLQEKNVSMKRLRTYSENQKVKWRRECEQLGLQTYNLIYN